MAGKDRLETALRKQTKQDNLRPRRKCLRQLANYLPLCLRSVCNINLTQKEYSTCRCPIGTDARGCCALEQTATSSRRNFLSARLAHCAQSLSRRVLPCTVHGDAMACVCCGAWRLPTRCCAEFARSAVGRCGMCMRRGPAGPVAGPQQATASAAWEGWYAQVTGLAQIGLPGSPVGTALHARQSRRAVRGRCVPRRTQALLPAS